MPPKGSMKLQENSCLVSNNTKQWLPHLRRTKATVIKKEKTCTDFQMQVSNNVENRRQKSAVFFIFMWLLFCAK
jgi:hypothetical protein